MEMDIEDGDLNDFNEEEADILRRSKRKNNDQGTEATIPASVSDMEGDPTKGRRIVFYRDSAMGSNNHFAFSKGGDDRQGHSSGRSGRKRR